jgi:hypothetical protein
MMSVEEYRKQRESKRKNAWFRNKWATNPEWREKKLAQWRARYYAKKSKVTSAQGTEKAGESRKQTRPIGILDEFGEFSR